MLKVSQKGQYAIRALYELAKRRGEGHASAQDIARAQAIPLNFLELILRELRLAGLVQSRRGPQGGYLLAGDPKDLTIGRVLAVVEGPLGPVSCIAGDESPCSLQGKCAFLEMWERARSAVAGVLDSTTFAGLIEAEKEADYVADYSI
jgi:Rrf2 family protein